MTLSRGAGTVPGCGVVVAVMGGRRALHYVLKVADRPQTARFFRDVLGMKVYVMKNLKKVAKLHAMAPMWEME
ncbi:hypothetical protein GDO81_005713 [Engystomops pustulosus]|uniref:VOC domain-containing protein n=1 Tax=Engystomops pustulosus TaxID=76066 RepID=A0AAV7CT88_ENGPU|nr:hypothetical protein GDO81_005713 [Engystomops pustulosus]